MSQHGRREASRALSSVPRDWEDPWGQQGQDWDACSDHVRCVILYLNVLVPARYGTSQKKPGAGATGGHRTSVGHMHRAQPACTSAEMWF